MVKPRTDVRTRCRSGRVPGSQPGCINRCDCGATPIRLAARHSHGPDRFAASVRHMNPIAVAVGKLNVWRPRHLAAADAELSGGRGGGIDPEIHQPETLGVIRVFRQANRGVGKLRVAGEDLVGHTRGVGSNDERVAISVDPGLSFLRPLAGQFKGQDRRRHRYVERFAAPGVGNRHPAANGTDLVVPFVGQPSGFVPHHDGDPLGQIDRSVRLDGPIGLIVAARSDEVETGLGDRIEFRFDDGNVEERAGRGADDLRAELVYRSGGEHNGIGACGFG